jgi:hypothetical protein
MTDGNLSDEQMKAAALRAGRATARYGERMKPARNAPRLEQQGGTMSQGYSNHAMVMAVVGSLVARVTDKAGTPGWLRFWYQNYARELYGIWRSANRGPLADELQRLRDKWCARQLAPDILAAIEKSVVEYLESTRAQG